MSIGVQYRPLQAVRLAARLVPIACLLDATLAGAMVAAEIDQPQRFTQPANPGILADVIPNWHYAALTRGPSSHSNFFGQRPGPMEVAVQIVWTEHAWREFDAGSIPGSLTPGPVLESIHHTTVDWLDVGTGPRPIWSLLPYWRGSGVAIDVNAQALAFAKRHFPRYRYLCADARRLPIRSSRFDAVSLMAMLTVLPTGAEDVLAESMRVLRSGGFVYIFDFMYDPDNEVYSARYRELNDTGLVLARSNDGSPLYLAKHWTLDELDGVLAGRAVRRASAYREVLSRSGNKLTGIEAIYEKVQQ